MGMGTDSPGLTPYQVMFARARPLDIADPNDPRNLDPNRNPGSVGWPVGGPFGGGHGDGTGSLSSSSGAPIPFAGGKLGRRIGREILSESPDEIMRGDINPLLRAALQGKLGYGDVGWTIPGWGQPATYGLNPSQRQSIEQELMALHEQRLAKHTKRR